MRRMETSSYKVLACWRCRGARLLPLDENSYRCPACDMPVSVEDVLGAWRGAEEVRTLTADSWDEFLRCHRLEEDGRVLLGSSHARSFSWGFVSLRELREYVDQGRRIGWLPPLDSRGENFR